MVQRKAAGKLGIQADHVKSDKQLSNLKLSSYSQNQDCKSRGADMKKKMKKSRSIKISDLESFQYSPSRKSLPQRGKPQPLQAPTASPSALPQKHHYSLVRTTDGSPNYMKATSSSHAKRELFPVSLRNTHSPISDFNKKLQRRFSSDSSTKSSGSCVSSKKPSKNLTRSSSLSLVRTLTKTTSFKASSSRTCSRKSTRAALCADMSVPERHTCSSTLKDSKFPEYLMLNPGGTESEGTSVMKVCPYTYCSLNGHCQAALPSLKSFVLARRRLLKTQKSLKMVEAMTPQRLKVPSEAEAKKDSEFELNVFDGKEAAHDEIGMDIFIEIYAKEKEEKPTGVDEAEKANFVKQVTPIDDLEEGFEKHFDDFEIEDDNAKRSFFQDQNAEDEDVNPQSNFSHEEINMGGYSSDEASYDGDQMDEDVDSGSKGVVDMEWEEDQFCGFDLEQDVDDGSDVFTEEEEEKDIVSRVESSSENSHDVSVTWLDDILGYYYEGIFLAQETLQETNVISPVLENETQETVTSSSTEEKFESLTNTEQSSKDNEKNALDEETTDNETGKFRYSSIENVDESNNEACQVDLSNTQHESAIQDQELLETDQGKEAKKFQSKSYVVGDEEEDTTKNWSVIRRKRMAEKDDEMRKFNPREPNFLALVPGPEPVKVDLRHQMMDDRKNAEDWMLDCALRQAVTKLAPARKKKVALLVEAFETVMPTGKCETQMRNNSGFNHARSIPACS